MKYVITKTGKVLITENTGHHKDLTNKDNVKSAGRFTTDGKRVQTYSKSYGFDVYPRKGDAQLIKKHLGL